MKKQMLTLLAVLLSVAAFGQKTHRSEKISFTVRESDTEYTIRSAFPADRAEKFRSDITSLLGKAADENRWSSAAYTATLSADHLEASLDKEEATGNELSLFKKLAAKLQAALDQPETPKQP